MSTQLALALKEAKRLGETNKVDEYRWALLELGRAYLAAHEAVPQQAQGVPKPCGTLSVSSTASTTTVDVKWSDPQPHTLPNGEYPLFIGERNADR